MSSLDRDEMVDKTGENGSKDNTSDDKTLEARGDFGSILASARKEQNHTIDDVTKHLKIPARIITALEENDLAELPEPIFTQGYLRTYARFLELPEDSILAAYNRVVPREQSSELKSSSPLPNETNSQSPLVRLVTIILLFAGIAAAIYAGYQYYQEKADIMESELDAKTAAFTGNSLDSPGTERLEIKQNARLGEDGELQLDDRSEGNIPEEGSNKKIGSAPNLNPAANVIASQVADKDKTPDDDNGVDIALNKKSEKRKKVINRELIPDSDVLEIIAEEDAWLDVRDASSTRLFYNILKQGRSKSLKGRAPFTVSLGNARVARVLINGIDVDMKQFIRSSNTAGFIVSSKQGEVLFH